MLGSRVRSRTVNAITAGGFSFDEAQRAWTRDQASKSMQAKRGQTDFDMSEPEFLISMMERHQDWCVIVCLIGGGQEINTGEAGLSEWLQALETQFKNWDASQTGLVMQTTPQTKPLGAWWIG